MSEKLECPVEGCGYNENMRVLEEAQARPLVLESTRSHAGEDAWRDMDHFNLDEELARLRRAVHEVREAMLYKPPGSGRHQPWRIRKSAIEDEAQSIATLLAFIAMAFDNIDENLVREGPLPTPWLRRTPPPRDPQKDSDDAQMKPDMGEAEVTLRLTTQQFAFLRELLQEKKGSAQCGVDYVERHLRTIREDVLKAKADMDMLVKLEGLLGPFDANPGSKRDAFTVDDAKFNEIIREAFNRDRG